MKISNPLLRTLIVALVLFISGPVFGDDTDLLAELNEEIVKVPLVVDGLFGKSEFTIIATVYRPPGTGPFPLIVLSHGNPANAADNVKVGRYRVVPQIREFIKRGFVVMAPIRRGFGATGGTLVETYHECSNPSYTHAGTEAAKDLIAAIEFAGTLAYVEREKVILVGQSAGGFASMAAASLNPRGLIAVVNFSGGRGGNPVTRPGQPCRPDRMAQAIGQFTSTIRVPVLWHYAENDKFFGPEHVKTWYAAFQQAGGKGRLVMQPPFGKDGHSLFGNANGLPLWTAALDAFLKEFGIIAVTASTSSAARGAN